MGDVADMKAEVLLLRRENKELCKERDTLARRIDELCQEVERLRQELAIRESSEQEKVIDYLGKECVDWEDKYLTLAGENAKLQELFNETLIRLAAASEATGGRFIDAWYCELLESNGIEVDEC